MIPGPVLLKEILQGRRVETVFGAARMAGHTEASGLRARTSGIPARRVPEKFFPFRSVFCSKLLLKEMYSLKLKKKIYSKMKT